MHLKLQVFTNALPRILYDLFLLLSSLSAVGTVDVTVREAGNLLAAPPSGHGPLSPKGTSVPFPAPPSLLHPPTVFYSLCAPLPLILPRGHASR